MDNSVRSRVSKRAGRESTSCGMRIGVISDTHGYFDPRIGSLFHGVEHILHAGDIGSSKVILDLEQIASVTAVLGNNDTDPAFRAFELVVLQERKFLLHHIVHPHAPDEALRRRLDLDRPDVVVFGHTHKPSCEQCDGILFFNPGYAGRQRFALSRTVGILVCEGDEVTSQILAL